ncbi:MAG: hypothetical protein LBG75_03090 [Candidatus Nomurabacteria bacterium]|jgi:uncharacterized coiled-coil protein SlyX|nr:hypothetical protein [Candidatus Nomurabacteria bacterium]
MIFINSAGKGLKKAIIAILEANNGSVSSGAGRNVCNRFFVLIGETYSHERVGNTRKMLEELEKDGTIALTRDDNGTPYRATLSSYTVDSSAGVDADDVNETVAELADLYIEKCELLAIAEEAKKAALSEAEVSLGMALKFEGQVKSLKDDKRLLEKEISQLTKQIDNNTAEKFEATIAELKEKLAAKELELGRLNSKLDSTTHQLEDSKKSLERVAAKRDKAVHELEEVRYDRDELKARCRELEGLNKDLAGRLSLYDDEGHLAIETFSVCLMAINLKLCDERVDDSKIMASLWLSIRDAMGSYDDSEDLKSMVLGTVARAEGILKDIRKDEVVRLILAAKSSDKNDNPVPYLEDWLSD